MFLDLPRKEVESAISRIGGTEEHLIRWLLKFSNLDLLTPSGGDWMNLRYEFVVFEAPFLVNHWIDDHNKNVIHLIGTVGQPKLIPMEEIEGFHSYIQDPLERVVSGTRSFSIEIDNMKISLFPPSHEVQLGKNWSLSAGSINRHSVLKYNFIRMVADFAHRIRRCPECKDFFLADRKNQFYCSLKHQNYASVKRYRKDHGLITGRQRGRPRKKDTSKKEGGS